MSRTDLYRVLELPSGAGRTAVVRAYRRLALRHHPDRFPPGVQREAAGLRMRTLNAAYAELVRRDHRSAPGARDRSGRSGPLDASAIVEDRDDLLAAALLCHVRPSDPMDPA